jgi:glycosyltransferase involved in cell wall biosynthesis
LNKPTRITVDLTAHVQGHAGLGRYAEQLTLALQRSLPPDESLAAFYNDTEGRQPQGALAALPATALRLSSKPWRMAVLLAQIFHLPQDRQLGRPDLFLATQHLLPRFGHARTVFTLHDLIFQHYPAAHLPLNRWFLNLAVPRFLSAADAIITVSECTRRDAMAIYGVPDAKIRVIYEAADERFKPISNGPQLDAVRVKYALPERYVLCVGTIEPRKNLPMLFEAWRQAALAGIQLVVTGKKGWLYENTFSTLEALGIAGQVHFTGFVADEDLPAVYSLAEAFALPSLYEGFGLPVLEAMACGTPVLCADNSSLPEVAGDAALLLAADQPAAWAGALHEVTSQDLLRADMSERGLRQAARFSWDRAASETRSLYREVYARRS